MAGKTTFGRREATAAPPTPKPAPRRAPPPSKDDLGPAAEAFRAELRKSDAETGGGFSDWMRRQRGRRVMAWVLGIALLAPGLLSFVIDMPLPLSIGLEAMGLVANWWLRRERRRHLQAVIAWDDPAGPG